MIYQGNSLEVIKTLEPESYDCIITSPPYYNVRDYKTELQIWGGDKYCKHTWVISKDFKSKAMSNKSTLREGIGREKTEQDIVRYSIENKSYVCKKCGAEKCELGLENNYNSYISHLCDIFDECKRILKNTGTLWVNIGDTYAGSGKGAGGKDSKESFTFDKFNKPNDNYMKKSMYMIPERFAIEMINRGWCLRNKIIWYKPNSLPCSAKDRFGNDYEMLYFFTKISKGYYFNMLYEPFSDNTKVKGVYKGVSKKEYEVHKAQDASDTKRRILESMKTKEGRQMRSVWSINTEPSELQHFALMPKKLVQRILKAGCPKQICTECGMPREDIYERIPKEGEEKSDTRKGKEVDSIGGRGHYKTKQRKYILPKSMLVAFAKWLKKEINRDLTSINLLTDNFDRTTYEHWFRTDSSGQSLPSVDDYKKLKELFKLNNIWDKWLLEEIETLVDDTGNSSRFYKKAVYCKCGNGVWKNGKVLDPFAGGGTTILEAMKLGWFDADGIELNPDYIKIIEERISKVEIQLELI